MRLHRSLQHSCDWPFASNSASASCDTPSPPSFRRRAARPCFNLSEFNGKEHAFQGHKKFVSDENQAQEQSKTIRKI